MWRLSLCVLLAACDCGDNGGDSCVTNSECGALTCVDGECVSISDGGAGDSGGGFQDQGLADAPRLDVPTADVLVDDAATTCVDLALEFSGEPTALEVPSSARFLLVKAWGAGGNNDGSFGGPGGFSSALYEVVDAQTLTAIVGRLGRNDGEVAFGFGARGAGGLSGLFAGPPPLEATERERAIVIAGGGGSSVRDVPPAGGAGNDGGGMPSMAGGNATNVGPGDRNLNTGGGGGYEGGIGRQTESTGGTGGTGIVLDAGGLRLVSIGGVPQSIVETSDTMFPPRQDDEDYPACEPGTEAPDCDPGVGERAGFMVVRVLCEEPPPLI